MSVTSLEETSDLILVQRAKENYSPAVAELINRYKGMVYTIALKVLKDKDEAEEVAQESFVKAFTKLNLFRMDSGFSSWLYRIAYNTAISRTREKKREMEYKQETVATESFEQQAKAFSTLEQDDRKRYLNQAMQQLNSDDSLMLILFYYDGKSLEEISQITGYSDSNVKVRLYRARKKLHEELEKILHNETKTLL
ncbi:sigma-70 family RNA polymerase sigma factor [uncultured Acetobacteroides sp.]|uniref:RNA polymerase sigma factor n=1 Tax=uncultured Acetobacteroides sp. TaxID=1760811 RepID=UPI0029F5439B|nr:sigma-70 family RNA polymerase sigma factor [uncultured Acetobacteroides sp.]